MQISLSSREPFTTLGNGCSLKHVVSSLITVCRRCTGIASPRTADMCFRQSWILLVEMASLQEPYLHHEEGLLHHLEDTRLLHSVDARTVFPKFLRSVAPCASITQTSTLPLPSSPETLHPSFSPDIRAPIHNLNQSLISSCRAWGSQPCLCSRTKCPGLGTPHSSSLPSP